MSRCFLYLLLFLFVIASCKPKTRDELIVGTWKVDVEATKKGLPPGKDAPIGNKDEMKIICYKDMTTQMVRTGPGGPNNKNGTYKLVHDGKYLDIMEEGREKPEEAEIVELTESTTRLRIPDSTIIVFAKVKS